MQFLGLAYLGLGIGVGLALIAGGFGIARLASSAVDPSSERLECPSKTPMTPSITEIWRLPLARW